MLLLLLAGCGASDGELMRSDGTAEPFRFADYEGRHLLINYWAEWCAPCRHEIPELNELDQDPALAVLGVNFDQVSGVELKDLLKTMNIEFSTLLADPAARYGEKIPAALPTTFVIAPDGNLKSVLVGPQTAATLRTAIAE
ncbi:MAG: TlpA disulfide reductase family protein [Pseudomonadota bacterium]